MFIFSPTVPPPPAPTPWVQEERRTTGPERAEAERGACPPAASPASVEHSSPRQQATALDQIPRPTLVTLLGAAGVPFDVPGTTNLLKVETV